MSLIAWLLSRIREIKGLITRLFWLRRYYFKLFITISSAFIVFSFFSLNGEGVYSRISNLQNYGYLTEAIAVLVLFFSIIKGWGVAHTDIVFEKLEPINDLPESTDTKINKFKNQAIIYNEEVNKALEYGSNPIKLVSSKFKLHPLISEMLPIFIFKMPEAKIDTSDDNKISLSSDIDIEFINNNQNVNLQKTSYFRDRLSNTLANYLVKKDGRVILDLRSNEVLKTDGSIYTLRESKLSNQIGGSTLLITSDSTLVMLTQGNRTAENPGRLAPAGSGSFDFISKRKLEDLTFQGYAKTEVLRELIEECGLKKSDIHDIQICGFGRYLYRNGKPEIFCIATTKKSSIEIEVPVQEWDYQQKQVQIFSFTGGLSKENVVDGLGKLKNSITNRDHGYENCSAPLYWNILFAKEYLKTLDKEQEIKLFDIK